MSGYFGIPLRNGLPLGLGTVISLRSGASGPANSANYWGFAQFGLAGTPWADVSRTGLGTRVDSAGLVGFGPHNLLLNSETLSTQNITTTAQQYTLKFSGAGTVTLSGTSSGTFSAGTNTFTATAGTLTLTVSGTVLTAQLNIGVVATEYVPTTTAARYLPRITHDPVTLSALGLLVEGQGTNLYPVSDTPSTRTVTVTAAAHTLSVYGTCTITLSGAATGTLTATGAANIRTTLTFTPSAGSLTMTVSGLTTGNRAQLETGSVATSYIPNPGTGSAVRVADSAGPGVALTGAALAAAFPAGFGQNTIVLRFRKSYSGALETLLALSAGASYSTGNGLLIRADGQAVTSGGNGSAAVVPAALVLDGAAVNRVAVSWSGANLSLSVNGSAAVPIGNLDFTGSGTTHLILGALTTGGLQGIGQAILESVRVLPGQYITGAALQALTA